MKRLSYFVPGRPLAFARAGTHGHRRYTPEPQKSYMRDAGWICKEAMRKLGFTLFDGPVRMIVHATFLTSKKRLDGCWKPTKSDLDNIVKLNLDSVNGIVFEDDAIICEISASKKWGKNEGVSVTFEALDLEPVGG